METLSYEAVASKAKVAVNEEGEEASSWIGLHWALSGRRV